MYKVKLMVLSSFFLSLVSGLDAQSGDTCSFQGEQVTGDFNIPGFCLLYRCIPGQGVTTIGCGIRVPPDGCFIVHPATKNYPECCYTDIACPGANQTGPAEFEGNELQPISTPQQNIQSYPQVASGFSPASPLYESTAPPRNRQSFSTSGPQPSSSLQPPPGRGFTAAPRSQAPSKERGREPPNVYGPPSDENSGGGSGPYYYKK